MMSVISMCCGYEKAVIFSSLSLSYVCVAVQNVQIVTANTLSAVFAIFVWILLFNIKLLIGIDNSITC